MGNNKQIVTRFSPEIYVVKGVIDRKINKLYALVTQDGDAIFSRNGKTCAFQRNDFLKVPLNIQKTVVTMKKVNHFNGLKSCTQLESCAFNPLRIRQGEEDLKQK